jgi:hypothetical protein
MKLLAIYTVFNGCELLQASVKQIRPFVDEVLIVKQTTSNRGQKIKQEDQDVLMKIDSRMITFTPALHLNAKENERQKMQQAIDWAKERNYTHFILLATDHFYKPEEIKAAIEMYKANPVDVTATKMYTYYKHPTWRLTPIEDYVMPFICRIHNHTHVTKINNYPWRVDPSVRITPAGSFYLYKPEEIMLHHYSMIRKDIRHKFENAAANQNWGDKVQYFIDEYSNYDIKTNPGVSYFGGRKIEVVKDSKF